MSDFELRDLGDGQFELSGAMSFATADRILFDSDKKFALHEQLQIDFSGVDDADSAGLALLLEWKALTRKRRHRVSFSGLPESIVAIARTTGVDHLL